MGADQEAREQMIRELEMGVDQLARQVALRTARSPDERRVQPAPRTSATAASSPAVANSAPEPAAPITRPPVSETIPAVPVAAGERTVRLADFINVIKKYWDMSPQEAMRLLRVKSLDGLNYREAFNSLKTIVESEGRNARTPGTQTQSTPSRPVVEAPRQRTTSSSSDSRPPTHQATSSSGIHTQGQAALKEGGRSMPVGPAASAESRYEPQPEMDFAGSPKAPIPIQIGVVRDISARASYAFEEEDEPTSQGEDLVRVDQSVVSSQARTRLDELKKTRGSSMASAQRLNVLHNVVGEQLNTAQMQNLVQKVWGASTLKKLKNEQVESLISWAKGDYFADEALAVLALLSQEEE
jgi:hypothetical protein